MKEKLSQYIAVIPEFENDSFDDSLSITFPEQGKQIIPDVLLLRHISCHLESDDGAFAADVFTITLTIEATLFNTPVTASAALLIVGGTPQSVELSLHTGAVSLSKGLSDLTQLVSSDAGFSVPDYFPQVEATLCNLKACISLTESKKLVSLKGGLSLAFDAAENGWSPLPDVEAIAVDLSELIRLQTLSIEFEWDSLMGVQWTVKGQTIIANTYNLLASYAHPQKRIYANLYPAEGAKYEFQSFLEDKLGLDASISNIIATPLSSADLIIDADIRNKNILFKLTNYHDVPWDFAHKLKVEHMELRIFFLEGKFSIAELYLDLTLPIGPIGEEQNGREDVVINLEGTFERDGQKNWLFEAEIDDPVAVGDFISGLAEKFGTIVDSIPEQIKELLFEDLHLSFEHQGDQSIFNFSGSLLFPIGVNTFILHVEVMVAKNEDDWEIHLSTSISIAGYTLSVDFDSNDTGKFLIASLSSNAKINLSALLHEIAPGELDAFIPETLELGLKNAFIAFCFPKDEGSEKEDSTTQTTVVFGLGLDMNTQLNLGDIPGIGPLIGAVSIGLNNMRVVGSTVDINTDTLAIIDAQLRKKNIPGLVATQQKAIPANTGTNSTVAFSKGVALEAELELPGLVVRLANSFGEKPSQEAAGSHVEGGKEQTSARPSGSETVAPESAKNRMLSPVGRQVGPFFVETVGLGVEDGKLTINFTGGVSVGPLTLELLDFSVSSPLEKFAPSFDLRGLAIGYDKPPLTVSGLLLRNKGEYTDKEGYLIRTSGFSGGISIGFNQVSITMLGAYDHAKKYKPENNCVSSFHSLFVYGYLGAPLGGPAFLYVTGLAVGLGFNRDLKMPEPTDFGIFPLTAAALKPSGTALTVDDLKSMMLSLDTYMPVKEGAFWLAVGIKFESFKFLSGFLMLALKFDHEIEINIIGIVDAAIQAGTRTIARISLGFTVRFLPLSGVLEAKGAFLPTTFIFHESVKIEGGMAMLAIFKDQTHGTWTGAKAGDFVLTLGGYGPLYKPKAYYPMVPPLKLSWKVSDNMQIYASAYFAVTPKALMLGAVINGIFKYKSSRVKVDANFTVAAHFIIYWQPVKYIGEAHADFHITGEVDGLFCTVSVDFSASADLQIYGPEFSGNAKLKLHFIVSFSVEVDFGNAKKEIKPLGWNEFKTKLLPAKDIVTLNIGKGILPESIGGTMTFVNPLDLKVIVDSQIPIKTSNIVKDQIADNNNIDFGIKSMGITKEDFKSNLNISVTKDSKVVLSDTFNIIPVYKNVPAALWQPASTSGIIPVDAENSLIENVICGYEISPKPIIINEKELITINSKDTIHHIDGRSIIPSVKEYHFNASDNLEPLLEESLLDLFYTN